MPARIIDLSPKLQERRDLEDCFVWWKTKGMYLRKWGKGYRYMMFGHRFGKKRDFVCEYSKLILKHYPDNAAFHQAASDYWMKLHGRDGRPHIIMSGETAQTGRNFLV